MMTLRWLAMLWPELVAVLLVLFLAGMLTGRALAEEPEYWPPCDAAQPDPRCPPTPDAGTCESVDGGWSCPDGAVLEFGNVVAPEDFRACTRDGHAARCDKGLEP